MRMGAWRAKPVGAVEPGGEEGSRASRGESDQEHESIASNRAFQQREARWGAHEALPHTPPGGKPPETRPPFPGHRLSGSGGICQGFAAPAKSAVLDRSPRFPEANWDEGKGASTHGHPAILAAPNEREKLDSGEVYLTNTGLLMEGAKTPRTTPKVCF